MGIIDIHHVHRMLANGLSASLHVCLVLLYLYVVYRVLTAVHGRRSACLSICFSVCVSCIFVLWNLYILCVLAAALGRLYVDNWRHGGNHPPTTIGLSTSTCSLDLRHIHGFRRNTNTNTNENTSTNTYVYTNTNASPAPTLCCRATKHAWLPMKHKDGRQIFSTAGALVVVTV